jgi:hypothetical protein
LQRPGADATVNDRWGLSWIGGYNPVVDEASRHGRDLRCRHRQRSGYLALYRRLDNDAPMLAFFKPPVSMSTAKEDLPDIPVPPNWITPGGRGFIEAAQIHPSPDIAPASNPAQGYWLADSPCQWSWRCASPERRTLPQPGACGLEQYLTDLCKPGGDSLVAPEPIQLLDPWPATVLKPKPAVRHIRHPPDTRTAADPAPAVPSSRGSACSACRTAHKS